MKHSCPHTAQKLDHKLGLIYCTKCGRPQMIRVNGNVAVSLSN